MRIYFDTEFIEDGKTIELLSLGAVREDGAQFYGVNTDADLDRASEWVKEHVIPHLQESFPVSAQYTPLRVHVGSRAGLANVFYSWALDGLARAEKLQFWGYFADYDWVLVCQLYGRMIDLPPRFPHFAYDLRQWLNENGFADARQPEDHPHHALLDARWVAEAHANYQYVRNRTLAQRT